MQDVEDFKRKENEYLEEVEELAKRHATELHWTSILA